MSDSTLTQPCPADSILTRMFIRVTQVWLDHLSNILADFTLKPAVHLHTPDRLIAEFNMGAYEYALTRRVSVTIATYVKFSD